MIRNGLVKGFVFRDPVFDGKTLEKLQEHPVFGPHVVQWIAQKRTDWPRMKSQLRQIQNRARRQRKWLSTFEKTGSELQSCERTLVSYATFYKWKRDDEDFKVRFQGIREMHAMSLLERARILAQEEANATDRWNLIKAEVPEYNPKKEQKQVTVNFNSDIEFSPQTQSIDTTAEDTNAA
jgi:hypothetical protein